MQSACTGVLDTGVVTNPIRSFLGTSCEAAKKDVAGAGGPPAAPSSGPAVASSNAALSRTERDTQCVTLMISWIVLGPRGVRARLGFMPNRPQHEAGIRIEPPPSVALAKGKIPAATAAAEPPDDPPVV